MSGGHCDTTAHSKLSAVCICCMFCSLLAHKHVSVNFFAHANALLMKHLGVEAPSEQDLPSVHSLEGVYRVWRLV